MGKSCSETTAWVRFSFSDLQCFLRAFFSAKRFCFCYSWIALPIVIQRFYNIIISIADITAFRYLNMKFNDVAVKLK